MLLGLVIAFGVLPAACHPVTSDRIYGRDLAAAIPQLQNLPPELAISYSPVPGQRRTFLPGELERIARGSGLDASFAASECFAWPTNPLEPNALLLAMRAALGTTSADIELLDQMKTLVPAGQLGFELTGLSTSSDSSAVWRGTLTYAPNRSLPIWARVRITVHQQELVAVQALQPGDPVTAAQLRLEPYVGPLRRDKNCSELEQILGKVPRVVIPAGTALQPKMLRELNDVERGDTVQVIVTTAATRIEVAAIAEEGGARGTMVTVRNVRSGRKFRARVEDRDKVSVMPNSTVGLTGEDTKS